MAQNYNDKPCPNMNHLTTQNIHGIFLMNKPLGISSNDALQIAKRFFGAQKAGHAGSLDPLASGLLLVLFGEATKFANILLNENKIYEVTAKLGVTTTTGDIEGEIIEQKPVPAFTQEQILQILHAFHGETEQIPPIYSALKHQGKPLYELARKNLPVSIEKRPIHVDYIELLSFEEDALKLRLQCSKGTYVRTLVEDIGKALGCGAHCAQLKRTAIGNYTLSNAHSLFELKEQNTPLSMLLPLNQMVPEDEKTLLSEAAAYYLFKGQSIIYPWPLPSDRKTLYLHLKRGDFIGIGEVLSDGRVAPVRLVDPRTLR